MNETSLSLLDCLRQSTDPLAWERLYSVYAPLLRTWLRRYEVQESDVDDLTQEVLLAVTKDIERFDHSGRTGAFRSWLRTILVHRLRHFWRTRGRHPVAHGDSDLEQRIAALEDPASDLSAVWNEQHDRHVAAKLLASVKSQFTPKTWDAFVRVALDGQRADEVAEAIGMSLNAVFVAKSRVLSRLRQQAAGLVDGTQEFRENS